MLERWNSSIAAYLSSDWTVNQSPDILRLVDDDQRITLGNTITSEWWRQSDNQEGWSDDRRQLGWKVYLLTDIPWREYVSRYHLLANGRRTGVACLTHITYTRHCIYKIRLMRITSVTYWMWTINRHLISGIRVRGDWWWASIQTYHIHLDGCWLSPDNFNVHSMY